VRLTLQEVTKGTRVRVRTPGALETGIWVIQGRVANSGVDDPAYDVTHTRSGRRRVFRRSRLILLRPPRRGTASPTTPPPPPRRRQAVRSGGAR
jgi:hypothetical protein